MCIGSSRNRYGYIASDTAEYCPKPPPLMDILFDGTWDGTVPDSRLSPPQDVISQAVIDAASDLIQNFTSSNGSDGSSIIHINLTISSSHLDALSCKWFLKDDLATQCYVGIHRTVLIWASFLFLVFVVGIPLVGAIIIWRKRRIIRYIEMEP
jgi:hypothetical protein